VKLVCVLRLGFLNMAESSSSQKTGNVSPVEKEWNLESDYNLAVIEIKVNDMKSQLKLYAEIAKRLHQDDWKYPSVQELLKL